ncbi:MAG: D-xylose ABC transporter ATP-binding protein [Flavobacteriaceae bacterium]|nr:MAG: D-xylose ABC transporter ATP-binding protein [Flavobacteriaceae bacterium]
MLEAKGITKKFGGVTALNNVNLSVHEGKVNVIVGENGAGKSTLMKVLSGVHAEYEGQVLLDGQLIKFSDPKEAMENGIAIIHQELNLIPHLSITENIFLGREIQNSLGFLDYKAMRKNAAEMLGKLGCDIDPRTHIAELRVGEQQMVEIAKALSINARVIIMDEPTSAISDAEVEILFQNIEGLIKDNVAILYISHKLDELFKIAHRFIALRDGSMVGVIEDVQSATKDDLIKLMVGRSIENNFVKNKIPLGEEVLRVEKINLPNPENPGTYLVQDMNLSVKKGEVVGIFGLMGAGRTEFFETVFGLHPKKMRGKIFIDGKEVKIKSVMNAVDAGIALVPEDRKKDGLILHMSIAENISMASINQVIKNGFLSSAAEKSLAKQYINDINIKTPSEKQEAGNLSGGNQQKIVIGKWLATKPKVLLLDEPTRGIDVNAKNEIYHLIDRLVKEGLAVIVVSSELPEIMAISDRILVMSESKVTASFTHEEAREDKIMKAAIL